MSNKTEIEKLIQELTIDKYSIGREILNHKETLKKFLEFYEDNVIVIRNRETLTSRAVLALYLVGRMLLYVADKIDSPDVSMDEIRVLIGEMPDSPEIVIQDFLNSGWIIMSSPSDFRINFRKIHEIFEEFFV